MDRFSRRRRDEQGAPAALPVPPGPVSNGEFVPSPADEIDRAVEELIRRDIAEASSRVGLDRRRFLQTAGAMAASLAAFELAGCSRAVAGPPSSSTRSTGS